MINILITGATGFVGANLLKKILEGSNNRVAIVIRKSSNTWRIDKVKSQLANIYFASLENKADLEGVFFDFKPDVVYHTATYGGFPGQVDQDQTINSNIKATVNLVDLAVKYGIRHFINTGSSSEYGLKNHPMKEDDSCQPISLYGITKLAATNYCTMIGKQQNETKICTLRLFSPYGDLEEPTRLYPSIRTSLLNNERPKLSRPESVRDFIPIEKVTDIYARILNSAYESGDVINVGSGKQQTIEQFFNVVAKELNKEHLKPIWGEAAPRAHEPMVWEADITKLKKLISME